MRSRRPGVRGPLFRHGTAAEGDDLHLGPWDVRVLVEL
jgi:hypothetical protein